MNQYPSTISLNAQFRLPVYCQWCDKKIKLYYKNQKYCDSLCYRVHKSFKKINNSEIRIAKEHTSRINHLKKLIDNLNDCGFYLDKKENSIVIINEETNKVIEFLQKIKENKNEEN